MASRIFILRCRFLPPPRFWEHALDLLGQVFHAGRRENFHAGLRCGDLDFDFLVVELAFAQLLAELLPRVALFRRLAGADSCSRQQAHPARDPPAASMARIAHDPHGLFPGILDCRLDQVADDGVHVTADIADLGKLGRLDLDEGRVGEACQAPRDLGLADAGGPDHQDVLRRDLGAQRLGDLHPAPAVAQGDGHRALGARLADDVLVEFGNDFRGCHLGHLRAELSVRAPSNTERSEQTSHLSREEEAGRGRALLPRSKFSIIRELRSDGSDWCRCTGRRRSRATS
jgi:hypothetical protein